MKILLINNFHYLRGGVERAYFDEAKILQESGHQVAFFSTNHPKTIENQWQKYFVKHFELSDSSKFNLFEKIKIVFRFWYNIEARRKLCQLLKEFKPDVAHLHNIFHYLSPSVVDELKRQEVPMAMTLHDFQFVCPNSHLFVDGRVWEESKNGKLYRCIKNKCVRNSYTKSLISVIEMYLRKALGTLGKIEVLTAPSDFLIEKAKELGFDKEIVKLPNPIIFNESAGEDDQAQEDSGGKYIIYYGRLGEEKAVDDLLVAFAKVSTDTKLLIAGAGPEREKLEKSADDLGIGSRVKFLGFVKREKLDKIIKKSLFMVSPSRCYENAPYVLLEAMYLKKLVICANLGGPNEIVENGKNGLLFEAGNSEDLAEKMKFALENEEVIGKMAQRGYLSVLSNNESEVFLSRLKETFARAIEISESKKEKKRRVKKEGKES